MEEKKRCAWLTQDPLYEKYHDEEWGVPQFAAQALFEMLLLEGLQAGLSWLTVLKKRAHYREVFHDFEPEAMAQMTETELERCMEDPDLIRNRLKMKALVKNAAAYLKLKEECGDAAAFLWQFVGGRPLVNNWRKPGDVPAETEASRRMSKALKQRGFTFVGPTICYAFMQAVGMVNDHQTDCWRHPVLAAMKGKEGGV